MPGKVTTIQGVSDSSADIPSVTKSFDNPYSAALDLLFECSPQQIRALELYDLRRVKAVVSERERTAATMEVGSQEMGGEGG